ncbi:Major facilitator superfamily protein [Zea mays]|uniref:Major facilitator superfamily protein n=1 Tax=Zea mays TaxID=4577 RepID=A0A1D6M334_MAIZE|nr:Major facilitator superfamily protein [Zea mays]AQK85593.1 Major facilitator superfamily protein [Zea mays]
MEEEKQVMEGAATAARRRLVIGVGFWVQGFRLFPWLGVNFFLKDGMGVAASSLQILQASANLPMVAKPLIGLLSDAVPIRGHRRLPYVAIGALLQAISWLAIALWQDISLQVLTIFLLLSNFGASISSYAVIPFLLGTMFFYQTEVLRLDSSVIGLSKVFGQVALLAWSMSYNKYFKTMSARKLLSVLQFVTALVMLSDVLFVQGVYRKVGIPDSIYTIVFSGLLEGLMFFKVLPFSVHVAKLCPAGCEGSVMAFVMSALALATIVSGYLGVALAAFMGVSGDDFSALPACLLIEAACTMLPLCCSSLIKERREKEKKQE